MGKYTIRVVTGDSLLAGSSNLVQLWLVGEHGEADLGKQLRPMRRGVSAGYGWARTRRPGTPQGSWGLRGRKGSLTSREGGPGIVSGVGGPTSRKADSERNRRDCWAEREARMSYLWGHSRCAGSLEPNRVPCFFLAVT